MWIFTTMKGFLISRWKWLPVVILSVVLAGVLVWRVGEHNQGVIVAEQETPTPFSSITPKKEAKGLIGQTEGRTSDELPPGLSNLSMEERRQKLTERREFSMQLQKESADVLLTRLEALWGTTGTESRSLEEKALVMSALTEALQAGDENSTRAAYQKLSALLRDESFSLNAKSGIASMLGSVQTPQSVQLLLLEYQRASDVKMRQILGDEIGRTGDTRLAGRFREDLSPPLEAAWPVSKNDPKLAKALANGLAKVGTAAGVQLLVNEVLRSTQTVEGLSDLKDLQGQAAFMALEKVRNPNAVPNLANGLLNSDSSDLQRYVCGISLAAMGRVEATKILLQWAATASDQETPWAEQWFGKLRDTASFDLVAAALSQENGIKFASATIRNAVVVGQSNRER